MTLSFHNDPALKAALVAEGEYHAAHNMIAHIGYGNDKIPGDKFRGCSIGCYAHGRHNGDPHQWGADFYGHPKRIWLCADVIYEGLSRNGEDVDWHKRWGAAIPVGVELSKLELVVDKLILMAARKKSEWYGPPDNHHLLVAISLYERRISGDEPSFEEWEAGALAADAALSVRSATAAPFAALSALSALAADAALSVRSATAAPFAVPAAFRDVYYRDLRDEYFKLMAEMEAGTRP
jgi:hypothetical protein